VGTAEGGVQPVAHKITGSGLKVSDDGKKYQLWGIAIIPRLPVKITLVVW